MPTSRYDYRVLTMPSSGAALEDDLEDGLICLGKMGYHLVATVGSPNGSLLILERERGEFS